MFTQLLSPDGEEEDHHRRASGQTGHPPHAALGPVHKANPPAAFFKSPSHALTKGSSLRGMMPC
jgi:hypothetical protein